MSASRLAIVITLVLGGCDTRAVSDSGADAVADAATDGSVDSNAEDHCQSVFFVPPTVAVTHVANGATSCDGVTFAVVSGPSGIPATPFTVDASLCTAGNHIGGCPADADAGSACVYALTGLSSYAVGPQARTFTVAISQSGYAPASVDVTTGYGGCFGEAAASHAEAMLSQLSPAADGGADGG